MCSSFPYSTGAARVLLCDAGGRREDRRHWVELVRLPAPTVGALVFVADVQDDAEETRDLFLGSSRARSGPAGRRCCSHSPGMTSRSVRWASTGRASLWSAAPPSSAVCARPFAVHHLCCHDAAAAERLLITAVGGATTARPELICSGQSREHVEELVVPDAAEPRVVLL